MDKNFEPKQEPEAPKEDIREIDGKKYKRVYSGYTIRQYFSHSTPEKGPGPGWDSRADLLDDERSMKTFGRTFTAKDVFVNTNHLPDDPFWILEEIIENDSER